jgi:hypothetical protein
MPKEIRRISSNLLKTELDAKKRAVIEHLLAEEEQKLAALKK